jgi:protocatechuate 3,4-dioxygenase beta subunit
MWKEINARAAWHDSASGPSATEETDMFNRLRLTRRTFLGATIVSGVAITACADDDDGDASPTSAATLAASTAGATPGASETQVLAPTPSCADDDDETPEQTEGPFFTPNSPERTSLVEPGMPGEPLTVSGAVLTTDCQPVAGALLDFWQANDAGEYDNEGYILRGHQFAGNDGSFRLETILPGLYPGRTRHIHVKVQAPNQPVLTTQVYFPGEPRNAEDGIFAEALVMDVSGSNATFTFVLPTA